MNLVVSIVVFGQAALRWFLLPEVCTPNYAFPIPPDAFVKLLWVGETALAHCTGHSAETC